MFLFIRNDFDSSVYGQINLMVYGLHFSSISRSNTVKQVYFAGNLISQISRKVQICKIELPQNCKFYIDNNGKFSILQNQVAAKLAILFNLRKNLPAKLTCFSVIAHLNSETK